jgi:hypothetical protein
LSQGWLRIAIYTHQQFRVAATATPPKHLVMLLFDKMHVFAARFCSTILQQYSIDENRNRRPDCLSAWAGARLPFIPALCCCSPSATKLQIVCYRVASGTA